MVNPKVLEILRKYSDERDPTAPQDISITSADSWKLEKFSHEFRLKLRAVLAELEHNLGLLKLRAFDKDMLKLLFGVWRHLENLYLNFDQHDPYQTARQIVQYLNDKHTKSVIDNLIFLTEHHVKTTNVKDFTPSKTFVNPEVRGLKLLLQLGKFAEEALRQPLPSSVQQTWRPPSTQSMKAIQVPVLPPISSVPTSPEVPEAKKQTA